MKNFSQKRFLVYFNLFLPKRTEQACAKNNSDSHEVLANVKITTAEIGAHVTARNAAQDCSMQNRLKIKDPKMSFQGTLHSLWRT